MELETAIDYVFWQAAFACGLVGAIWACVIAILFANRNATAQERIERLGVAFVLLLPALIGTVIVVAAGYAVDLVVPEISAAELLLEFERARQLAAK